MTMVQSYKCILGLKLAEDLESVPTTTTSSDPTQLTLHKLHGWLCDDEEEVKYFSFLLSRRFENMRRDIDGIFPRGSFHFLQRQSLSLSIFSTQGILQICHPFLPLMSKIFIALCIILTTLICVEFEIMQIDGPWVLPSQVFLQMLNESV